MFIDASALAAIIAGEADAPELLARLQQSPAPITSPVAVWETAVAIGRLLGLSQKQANKAVFDYLELAQIELVAVPPKAAAIGLDAFDRFGKGRHPAQLNMGDCFAYACARHFGQPLLSKGGDFPLTDIEAA